MTTKLELDNSNKYAPWIAFVRIFLGVFWLIEVTIGHNWKIGSFTSGPHPGWFGPEAGSYLIEQGNAGMEAGGWAWFGWVLENIMYPQAAMWGYVAVAVQLILAVSFIFGIFSRPIALLGLGMDLFIFMLGNSRIPPFFSLGHLFVLGTNAGMYYGVDAWLVNKYKGLKSIITLDFINLKMRRFIGAIAAVLAVYFLLKLAVIDSGKMKMVSMDLAVLLGLISYALFVYRDKVNNVLLTTSLMRIWLGYRFLHEVIVRHVPGLNGLPGGGTTADLTKIFTEISEKHWGLFSGIVDVVFLPMMGFWNVFFTGLEVIIAVMLILGIRTRLISRVALIYLGVLILIGFTRYAPFLFGYLIAVYTLEGGRMFSFDALNNTKFKAGMQISKKATIILLAIALVFLVAANIDGIEPDGYRTTMGPWVGVIVSTLAGLLGFVGLIQNNIIFSKKDYGKSKPESVNV